MLLLSHDHLDFHSIQKLKTKVKTYCVALGVARHLIHWGINSNQITEFDWWGNKTFNDLRITFTPTRHFSGRGISDRFKSLWGGWAIKTPTENILFSGDSGYGKHFKEIGKRLGPFDLGFMECGQYNALWHQIHMFPEESVKAGIDANIKTLMPVHWAGFSLAQHSWTDPVDRLIIACQLKNVPFIVPSLGELVTTKQAYEHKIWWEKA